VAGVDVEVSDWTAIATEMALHMFGGPRQPSVTSGVLVGIRLGAGMRVRC